MTAQTRVAIVDDDPRVRESLESLFDSAQMNAHFFTSAEALLEEDLANFDCVVSDVRMPRMSGFDLQKILHERKPRLPLIFISAYPDDKRIEEAISLGAVAFLQKPFDGEELLEWVGRAVHSLS